MRAVKAEGMEKRLLFFVIIERENMEGIKCFYDSIGQKI